MRQLTNISNLGTVINKNEKIKNNTIIMNMGNYKNKLLEKNIEKHLLKAEDDIRNGRVKDAREVFTLWKEKFGI